MKSVVCRGRPRSVLSLLCALGVGSIVWAQADETGPESEAVQLDDFVVSAGAQKGYITTATTTATRTNTPIVDIPSTINIVNRELLDDTGVFEFRDAAVFVSGVTHGFEHSNLLNVRGTAVRNPLLNTFSYGTQLPLETALIDRIEIIKGPNAILAPTGLAGGDVNAVLKEPLGQPLRQVRAVIGNYERRAEYDLTGPAIGNDHVLYRVAGAVEDSEGYRDFFDTRRMSAAPSLTWIMSPRTTLTVLSAFDQSERQIDAGLPIVNGRIPDRIDRTFNPNDASFDAEEDFRLLQAFLRTHLSDTWRMQMAASTIENTIDAWEVQNTSFNATTGDVGRGGFFRTMETANYGAKVDFVGTHDFAKVQSKLQVGLSWGEGEYDEDRAAGSTFGGPVNVYTGARPDPSTYVLAPLAPAIRDSSDLSQAFVIEQVTLFDGRLIANAGVTTSKLTSYRHPLPQAAAQTTVVTRESEPTKQYGVVFKPVPDVSLYYGFSQNFRGQNGRLADGSPLGSSFGELNEGGVKAYIYKQQIFATASVFEISQTNQAVNDPNGGAFQVPIGDLTVKGFECDINAYFENGLSFIATYSQLEAPLSTGLRTRTVPEEAASFWGKYAFRRGALQGWSAGFSVTYRGSQYADVANTPNGLMPAVTLLNGFVGWEGKNLNVRLNLNNLTDEDYIRTGVNLTRHQPGDPLNARLSVTCKF